MLGLRGKKRGMSQVFGPDGEMIPVTVVEVNPCVIIQKKTKARDGYDALQLASEEVDEKCLNKPQLGFFKKAKSKAYKNLTEFRSEGYEGVDELQLGQALNVEAFSVGEKVHVCGTTKGRGFQGVVKRYGHAGGPGSHGSTFHRAPGSLGQCSSPSRVFKNTKLPGHMGCDRVMIKNVEVVAIRPEDNVVLLKGAVPGTREGMLEIFVPERSFATRETVKGKTQEVPVQAEAEQPSTEA